MKKYLMALKWQPLLWALVCVGNSYNTGTALTSALALAANSVLGVFVLWGLVIFFLALAVWSYINFERTYLERLVRNG